MFENYAMWALAIAILATALIRASGSLLARSPILNRIPEEILSRHLPMSILFCLVFKEIASEANAGLSPLSIKIGAVILVIALHLWRKNLFISVIGGTAFYVLLLRLFGNS